MTQRIIVVLALIAAFALFVLAANVDGKWAAQIPSQKGQARETVFTLKADGNALTGSMSGRQGDTPISDGKIDGDTVTFSVTVERGGNTIKWNFTGKVAGDEMQMKREGGQGPAREFTAKRVK